MLRPEISIIDKNYIPSTSRTKINSRSEKDSVKCNSDITVLNNRIKNKRNNGNECVLEDTSRCMIP